MPAAISDLERGAVCLALYPFTTTFPAERVVRDAEDELLAQIERVQTIENLVVTLPAGGPPAELIGQFKLRRVLVLHDGTAPSIQDVSVARINSVTPEKIEKRKSWYRRLQSGVHPTSLLIGHEIRHGTNGQEAYVDCLSIASVPKATVLRREGALDDYEMREISRRVVNALEIDC